MAAVMRKWSLSIICGVYAHADYADARDADADAHDEHAERESAGAFYADEGEVYDENEGEDAGDDEHAHAEDTVCMQVKHKGTQSVPRPIH